MDSNSELELLWLANQIYYLYEEKEKGSDFDLELATILTKAIILVGSMDFDSLPKPHAKLISLIADIIPLFSSISDAAPEYELISLIKQKFSVLCSVDSSSESKLKIEFVSLIRQLINPTSKEPESESESEPESEYEWQSESESGSELELIPSIRKLARLVMFMEPEPQPESKLISFVSDLLFAPGSVTEKVLSVTEKIVYLVWSVDLDSPPKPESELMSLFTQTIYVFNSMEMDSQPEPLSGLISLFSNIFNSIHISPEAYSDFKPLLRRTLNLEPQPELLSLIHQIISLVSSMDSERAKLISLCPQVLVELKEGKFREDKAFRPRTNDKLHCLPSKWVQFRLTKRDEYTHFWCRGCGGDNHEKYDKGPVEIKHPLHPKHSLRPVLLETRTRTRKCYCCDEDLNKMFYYCSACDYSMNMSCVEKQPVLSIDHPKWHEHTLYLFSRTTSLTCDACALADSSCSFYICPPCGFVIHRRCINLPRVLKISRHLHRMSFASSFGKGDWACGVCRRKVDNDYGGYACIKDGCLYAAHSKCATQSNVWDGRELLGVLEEPEEELEPFVRISHGIIRHFSHEHHHLRLDENTGRDYDENKLCQACIRPIYSGNFYSCTHYGENKQCNFILHETCANLSRKIYHPIHPHMLTLLRDSEEVAHCPDECTACSLWLAGFFYKCLEEGCSFELHVCCGTISEPLVHASHMHPLFLTSKPGEWKACSVCKYGRGQETFNCIECDFALCFECAILPHKVRYKHDKHMLTLSYGEETSTMKYWCESCEKEINPKKRFYMCDEYCCVTLHVECLLGVDLYLKPGYSWDHGDKKINVLPNNQHMSRPFCSECERRCSQKIALKCSGLVYCSRSCLPSLLASLVYYKYKPISPV